MRLIHITDPHLSSLDGLTFMGLRGKRRSGFLSWRQKRRRVHRPEILEQLTEAVNSHQPDLVLVTGDLVHIGLESEMIEAADWLRRLGPPEKVMFVPGNHDNYARDSLSAMRRHLGSYLPDEGGPDGDYTSGYPVVREWENLRLLGVNTSCVTRIFSAAGELGTGQRQRLIRALKKKPGDQRFQCLLIHHPPFPGMTRRRKALRDSVQLRDIVKQQPPDMVLYGHIHCNREDTLGDTAVFCTASASSIDYASYRIFDLEQEDSGWSCRMRLATLENGSGPNPSFSITAESCWRGQACASPAKTAP
jgi:3',5'-cyclic AMP phosphodiesterase CpdA